MPCHLMAEPENGAPITSQVWGSERSNFTYSFKRKGLWLTLTLGRTHTGMGGCMRRPARSPRGTGRV